MEGTEKDHVFYNGFLWIVPWINSSILGNQATRTESGFYVETFPD